MSFFDSDDDEVTIETVYTFFVSDTQSKKTQLSSSQWMLTKFRCQLAGLSSCWTVLSEETLPADYFTDCLFLILSFYLFVCVISSSEYFSVCNRFVVVFLSEYLSIKYTPHTRT